MTPARLALAVLLLLAAPRTAGASVADVFGLGSPFVAAGNAGAAEAADFSACFLDPAGLAFAARPSLALGYALADARISADHGAVELEHAGGAVVGLSVPLDLPVAWLPRLAFGLALYAPPDVVVAIRGRPPQEPALPYYDRLARWLVLPSVALRLPGGVALGAALDVFAGIRGPLEITDGPTGAVEGRAALELFGTVTPIVGLRWEPFPWLSFGATYRAEFAAPASTIARAEAGGASVRLEASIDGLFRPHTVVLGAAVRGARWRLALDVDWQRWSAFRDALFDVSAELQGVGLDPAALELPFRDSFGVRLGGEYRIALRNAVFAVRAGYGFQSRILPEGTTGAALLDGDKHVLSTGLGLRLPLDDGSVLTLDLHLAAHLLAGASAVVPSTTDGAADRTVTAEGAVLATGFQLGVEW